MPKRDAMYDSLVVHADPDPVSRIDSRDKFLHVARRGRKCIRWKNRYCVADLYITGADLGHLIVLSYGTTKGWGY
jgi:hypothetical protein